MYMLKYVLKRIGLLFLSFFVIMTICFVLVKLLQPELPMLGQQAKAELARREALGYNKPILEQYAIYLRNIITRWDWGTSWKIDYLCDVRKVIADRLTPTLILNAYSILISIPVGILLGVIAALRKNKPADHIISTLIMLFVSVPSYVYAFIVQYLLGFRLNLFPVMLSSLYDAGGSWFSPAMIKSMALPVLALSFGTVADLARYVRAELTEALTSEYMLLARAKGLTKTRATLSHALINAMVPVLPMIISLFLGILGGSMIIERIFAVNGIGSLYIKSIELLDYDVFIAASMFYTFISLSSSILVDLSYGFLDPRIRMGAK